MRGIGATNPSYIPARYMPLWSNCPVNSMHRLLPHPAVDPASPSMIVQAISDININLTEEVARPSPQMTVEDTGASCNVHFFDNSFSVFALISTLM